MSGGEEDLMQTDQITEVVDFFQPLFLVDQVLAIGNKMKRATKEASRQWPMHAEIYIMSSPKFPRFNAISESMTPCLTAFARERFADILKHSWPRGCKRKYFH